MKQSKTIGSKTKRSKRNKGSIGFAQSTLTHPKWFWFLLVLFWRKIIFEAKPVNPSFVLGGKYLWFFLWFLPIQNGEELLRNKKIRAELNLCGTSINVKCSQIVGNIVVYNPKKFQIDSSKIDSAQIEICTDFFIPQKFFLLLIFWRSFSVCWIILKQTCLFQLFQY